MASAGISDTTAQFSVSRALNLSSGGIVLADRRPETDYGHQDPADKYGRQRCVDELHNYEGDAFQYLPVVGLPQPATMRLRIAAKMGFRIESSFGVGFSVDPVCVREP